MELSDYENDPYAPDPRASQRVAAQKRQRPAHDTEPITPIAARSRSALPFGIGALIVVLLMIGMASYGLARLPSAVPLAITPVPTDAPAFLAAAPEASPAPPLAPTAAPRTIGAYASPDGLLLGQIEVDRQITPVAHFGTLWIQADVEGSGMVWLRKSDVPDAALIGPDLAPVAQQPQTGRGLTVDQGGGWTPPDATPEPQAPAEPTAVPNWPTSAPVVVTDFTQPDIKQTCQFIGCLGQQAVDLARAQACHALFWQYGDADPETIAEPDLSAVRGCIWEGLYR